MRNWALPLLSLLLAPSLAAQETSTPIDSLKLEGLKIPAELTKTIKAEKIAPGAMVEFRLAEPILVGQGLVLPGSTKLFGRVLRAVAAEDGKDSRLSLVVERAEWKGHILPLRAFITGFGARKRRQPTGLDCLPQPSAPAFRSKKSPAPQTGPTDSTVDPCSDGNGQIDDAMAVAFRQMLSTIRVYKNNFDGRTVLVSSKNIHLPAGMLLMFSNESVPEITAKK